ncbi:MAG: Ig-like domain-containing protein [Bacteroidales bacterium]|nr:Ig-like domain-containing protein [Bacteroidales bacterium]
MEKQCKMKRPFSVLLVSITAFSLLLSCVEENGPDGNQSAESKDPIITVGAEHISAISVVLIGKANLDATVAADFRMGFQLSTSAGILPTNSTIIDAQDADASYNFSAGISCLEPNTKYFFRSFIHQREQFTYGETKEFTTRELSSLLNTEDVSSISAISAKLNATVDMTDVQCGNKLFGFYYGTSPEVLDTIPIVVGDGRTISANVTSLLPSTPYHCQAFVLVDKKEYKGASVDFTTKDLESLLATNDASEIGATSATLNGKLNLEDVLYDSASYGFFWGKSQECLNEFSTAEFVIDSVISSNLTNLAHKTQYWYKSCVQLDSQTFYGAIKTFTTDAVPVETVYLDKSNYTFSEISDNILLQAIVLPEDATNNKVTWVSDNESVAEVDSSGMVTAKSNGSAIITVTTVDGSKTDICQITVAQAVSSVSLNKTRMSLYVDETDTLVATILPENAANKEIQWKSLDPLVATVDINSGVVTGLTTGTTTIVAQAMDGSQKIGQCNVTVKQLVTSICFDKDSLVVYTGTSMSLDVVVKPDNATDKRITWTSSDLRVARFVNKSGMVKGITAGTAIVTATSNDGSGISASCPIEIRQSVTSIDLDSNKGLTLYVGDDPTPLTAYVLPEDSYDNRLVWTSSSPDVATIDQNGLVTPLSAGATTIYAEARHTNSDGKSYDVTASCLIYVAKRLITNITFDRKELVFYLGLRDTPVSIVANIEPENAYNKTISWSSSDESVATVDNKGIIVPQSLEQYGDCYITARANDGSDKFGQCRVCVSRIEEKTVVTPDSVDLGLSVKWASFNLGATKPEEIGDTYPWGEVFGENEGILCYSSYPYSAYRMYDYATQSFTKYNSDDGKVMLDPEDDVAHTRLGNSWRMPTVSEMRELLNPENCSIERMTLNGQSGLRITSKRQGFEGNSIFLPKTTRYMGSFYWSSSLGSYPSTAWGLSFGNDYIEFSNGARDGGAAIRPVVE